MFQPRLIPRFYQDVSISDLTAAFSKQDEVEAWNNSNRLFTGSGRYSLFLALASLDVEVKKIVVPSFICPAVFDGLLAAGFEPLLVDVDRNLLLDIDKLAAVETEFSVILVHHAFGKRMNIARFKERFPEKIIIEDCCHDPTRLLEADLQGADFLFYSFGMSKFLTIGSGGLLVVADPDQMDSVKKCYEQHTEKRQGRLKRAQKVFKRYVFAQLYQPPLYGLFARDLGTLVDRFIDVTKKRGIEFEELNEYFKRMLLAKYKGMQQSAVRQRETTLRIVDGIRSDRVRLLPREYYANDHLNFMCPVLVDDQKGFHQHLMRRGVDSCTYLDSLPAYYDENQIKWKHCAKTARVLDNIVAIPNYYTLSEKQIDHVIEVVNSY